MWLVTATRMEPSFSTVQQLLLEAVSSAAAAAGFSSAFGLSRPLAEDRDGVEHVFSLDLATGDEHWNFRFIVPTGVRVVAHGHSAALWLGDRQLAEIHLDSTAAGSLNFDGASASSPEISLRGAAGSVRILLRMDDFLLKDRDVGRGSLNWRRHDAERSLNYLLDGPSPGARGNKLLVVFSAIGAEHDFTFNYRSTVENNKLAKAFVLDDFGRQGSYYWADHGDDSIFQETQRLLRILVAELDVNWEDVMFAGSSKGGTAALLHGVTLGVGRIVLGAPQYRVGDYLFAAAPRILEFMTGGATDAHRVALNECTSSIVRNGQRKSSIRVAVGSADHHLKSHVLPLMEEAKAAGYSIENLTLPGVPHSEIGGVFKHLLSAEVLNFELDSNQSPLPHSLVRDGDVVEFRCWPAENESVAVHVFGKTGVLERRAYSQTTDFILHSAVQDGPVRLRVFRRSDTDGDISAFTTVWV